MNLSKKLFIFGVLVVIIGTVLLSQFQEQNQVQEAGNIKEFKISAIDVDITINRFGDHDPLGKMYVLDENIDAVRQQEVAPLPDRVSIGLRDDPIQPLVIRANIGDTVVVHFTNRLTAGRAGMHIHGLPVDLKNPAAPPSG